MRKSYRVTNDRVCNVHEHIYFWLDTRVGILQANYTHHTLTIALGFKQASVMSNDNNGYAFLFVDENEVFGKAARTLHNHPFDRVALVD